MTRDAHSLMGTESGLARIRRSKHSAALCFTESIVSLRKRTRPSQPAWTPARDGSCSCFAKTVGHIKGEHRHNHFERGHVFVMVVAQLFAMMQTKRS